MKSAQDYVNEARAVIRDISVEDAAALPGALFVDVREASELAEGGTAAGALHVPRGRLENRADPDGAGADATLTAARGGARPVVVFCNGGGRGIMATRTLMEMGYDARCLLGGLRAWFAAGKPKA